MAGKPLVGRWLRRLAVLALVCGSALSLSAASPAQAEACAYTDKNDYNLVDYERRYGGSYTISSVCDGNFNWRWLDSPNKTTVISGNSCGDGSLYGKNDIPAFNTNYHLIFRGFAYLCFELWGRTASGSGGLYNHDGSIRR